MHKKDVFVERYISKVKDRWLSTSACFPEFLQPVADDVREQNNKYIEELAKKLTGHIDSFSRLPHKKKKWKQGLLAIIDDWLFSKELTAIHRAIDPASLRALYNELMEFLRQERHFSPELTLDEIGQAIRNYIVYAMFKLIHKDESPFSMAAFGYSMLYPFTDNYIDSSLHLPDEKQAYNRLIRSKISGEAVKPATRHEKKTCRLLSAIESEYPRSSNNEIYQLLLMMLDAQELSIKQQNTSPLLSEEERLDISLYKGGVSVLIDRYLVKKALTEDEIIVYLGLGFFLQLADDLQDIGEDSSLGYQTLLTINTTRGANEKTVNKLLNFIHEILTPFKPDNELVKDFVLDNCYQLIFTSVIGSREFFSDEYINRLEKLMIFKTEHMRKLRDSLYKPLDKRNNKKYLKMLDVAIS